MQFFEFVIYASSRHGEHGFIAVDWAVFHGDLLVDCFACMEREEGLIMTKNKIANNSTFPSFDSLINSVFKALVHLGGSASIDEIYETVIIKLRIVFKVFYQYVKIRKKVIKPFLSMN